MVEELHFIHERRCLWTSTSITGTRFTGSGSDRKLDNVYKERKGFGYNVKGRNGPGDTTIREFLGRREVREAVLEFLRSTKVGMLKSGAVRKEEVVV